MTAARPSWTVVAQLVAQQAGTPGHFNSITTAARGMLEVIPLETIEPGDVMLTNDP